MLRKFFSKKKNQPQDESLMKGKFFRTQNPESLLKAHLQELNEIKEIVGVSEEHFKFLYQGPIERYISAIQLVPASESYHHAGVGGMLQHIMEVMVNALRLRRGHILPQGVDAEVIELKKDLWTFVIFVAALLHDVGKIISDVHLEDEKGNKWNLLSSSSQPKTYKVSFNTARKHKFHEKLGAFALHKILTPNQVEWVMSDEDAWYMLTSFLVGDYSNAGVLYEIVQKADQASVAANLGGDVKSVTSAPVQLPLSQRVLKTLQQLVASDVISLNRPGAFGFYSGDFVYFVVARTLDAVKDKMRSEGQSVPNDRNRLMDELQQFEVIEKTGDGKAVFSTSVRVGEWEQNLKLLKMSALKVWATAESRPDANPDVEVIELDSKGDAIQEAPATESKDKSEVAPKQEAKPKAEPEAKPSVQDKAQNTTSEPEELDELMQDLEELIKAPEAVDELDMSSFDDSMYDDFETEIEDKPNNPETSIDKDLKNDVKDEPELNSPALKEQVMEDVLDKVKTAEERSVNYYNQEVLDNTLQVKFDDPDEPGAVFIRWLVEGLKDGSIPMNSPGNLVHHVSEGLFVISPRVFKQFESVTGVDWKAAQRQVQRKKINLKTPAGENIFEYEIISQSGRKAGRKVKGMLFPNPEQRFGIKLTSFNEYMRQTL